MSRIQIAILGTCRVHDPINAVVSEKKPRILTPIDSSYIHTSSEAIQRINSLMGVYSYPEDLSNFQVGNRAIDLKKGCKIEDSDVVLVEISSIKILSVGDHFIQFNHTVNRIKRIDDSFSKEWLPMMDNSFSKGIKIPRDINFPSSISEDEREIISNIVTRKQPFIELREEMQTIHKLLGDKVIFVTHVAALKGHGKPILSRERLINEIVDCCEENNFPVIDPSEILQRMGQKNMMAKGGIDTNHYNEQALSEIGEEFIDRIMQLTC